MNFTLQLRGPILAKLCAKHFNQLMDMPPSGTFGEKLESFNDRLRQATHGMHEHAASHD